MAVFGFGLNASSTFSCLFGLLFAATSPLIHPTHAGAILFPYGAGEGDQQVQIEPDLDTQSATTLAEALVYFEHDNHTELYISPNGAISLSTPIEDSTATKPLDAERKDAIAVFYAPSSGGRIFYRSSAGGMPLSKEISAKIRRAFIENTAFEATSVVLITWEDVGNLEENGTNTYQLALAINEKKEAYAILVYHKLEWFESDGQFAQAGFFSFDGRGEKLVNSGTASVLDLIRITNFNEAGLFLYKVSGSQPMDPRYNLDYADSDDESTLEDDNSSLDEQIVECPVNPFSDHWSVTFSLSFLQAHCSMVMDDNNCELCICSSVPDGSHPPGSAASSYSYSKVSPNDVEITAPEEDGESASKHPTSELACSPADNEHQKCHDMASCVHTEGGGHCCECQPDHYGNGVECLLKEKEQRVSGSFEGAINGKQLEKSELHAYINVRDGLQHTAITGIPENFAKSLMLIDAIGNGFGWLFARNADSSSSNILNGFQLTGGTLNRSVSIHVGDRYSIALRQHFTELGDSFNVDMVIHGTLPDLSSASSVEIPDFEEIYRRESPGFIRAYTERHVDVINADGTEQRMRMTTDQQIHYHECPLKVKQSQSIQSVKFQRVSVQYGDPNAPLILRFASQATVHGSESPSSGDTSLSSNSGQGQSAALSDVCANVCDAPNMHCTPTQHSYKCECNAGYEIQQRDDDEGGFECIDTNECDFQQPCDESASCENLPGTFRCVCPQGYVLGGDRKCMEEGSAQGSAVVQQAGQCTAHQQCHQWGECVFSTTPGQPGHCKCRGWYVGDGVKHCGPPEVVYPLPVDTQRAAGSQENASQSYQQNQTAGSVCRGDNECGSNANCVYSRQHGHYKCECQSPFKGDGVDCILELSADISPPPPSPSSQQPDGERYPCRDQSDCHMNGHCVEFENASAPFLCQCLPGFEGDGKNSCVQSEECSPSAIPSQCTEPNTACQFSQQHQKFTCQCESGYQKMVAGGGCGSGAPLPPIPPPPPRRTCREDRAMCHQLAECVHSNDAQDYICVCRSGTTGDGYLSCQLNTCFDDRSICSPNADCVPNEEGTAYVCNCNYGYVGNGRLCEPSSSESVEEPPAQHVGAKLLIGRGMSIIQRSTNLDVPGRQLLVVPHQVVVDIAYECKRQRIYWSDIAGHAIRSSALNGTEITSTLTSELRSPEGIAIDSASGNLYYVDSIKNEIGVATLDGKYQKSLLSNGLSNPRAIVIDLRNRQLYYSDWQRTNPRIGRMALDGTTNRVFISDDVHLPNGMALLPNRNELCWVDAGSQRLSCIQLDGTRRRVVYAPLEYPFGLTHVSEERFYWTDWKDHKIHSVSVYGDSYRSFLPGAGGRGKIYGLISLNQPLHCATDSPTECARGDVANPPCKYLCLPPSQAGAAPVCKCPDNIDGVGVDC